ncbi:MAG: DUF92 domain-containing protein [Candidatus Thorarchaeota archaeon]
MDELLGNIILPIALVGVFVFFWLFFSEYLSRKNKITKIDARKLLHIMVGNVVFFLPLFHDKLIVFLIPFVFIFFNFFLTPYGPIKKLRMDTFEHGHALGTVWYAVSLTVLVVLSFDIPWIIAASFLPLAYGDGLAAVVGSRAHNGFLWSFGGKKSLLGTWTFIWATFFSVLFGLAIFNVLGFASLNIKTILLLAIVLAIIASLIEFFSPKGLDNLFIPIGALIFLNITYDFLNQASLNINLNVFMIGIVIALFFGIFGYYMKFLTLDGSMAGFFMGMVIMGIGGFSLGIALLIFFIVGSFVTKLNNPSQQSSFEKGSSTRDSMQAIAKAGFATIVALSTVFWKDNPIVFMIFIATLGTSLVDTIATEIGIYTKGQARYILAPWRTLKTGESGGISFNGTIAGILTAFIFTMIIVILIIIDPSINQIIFQTKVFLIVPLASVCGMFIDSILGATIQEQRLCEICNKKVEAAIHCSYKTKKVSGFSFIKNDMVNFLAVTLGGCLVIVFNCFSI